MNKSLGFAVAAAIAATIGCTTTKPERDYQADQAPPLVKGDAPPRPRTNALPPPVDEKRRVSADEITDENVHEKARLLEDGLNRDRKAMSKTGR